MIKAIGFDATEDHRTGGGGTFAVKGDGKNICAGAKAPHFRDRYDVRYYLREWGMNREACGKSIDSAGLPRPPKSACFFCPATTRMEIEMLQITDPVLYMLAVEMERVYRGGKHFRGDNVWTVKAKHKVTGEEMTEELRGETAADVRSVFRSKVTDIVKPYQWQLRVSAAVVGLGRKFRWETANDS